MGLRYFPILWTDGWPEKGAVSDVPSLTRRQVSPTLA